MAINPRSKRMPDTSPTMNDRLLNVHEAADYLGVSRDVMREMLRNRKLAGMKPSGQWRIPQSALINYVLRQLAKS